jgi:hypothetical protein
VANKEQPNPSECNAGHIIYDLSPHFPSSFSLILIPFSPVPSLPAWPRGFRDTFLVSSSSCTNPWSPTADRRSAWRVPHGPETTLLPIKDHRHRKQACLRPRLPAHPRQQPSPNWPCWALNTGRRWRRMGPTVEIQPSLSIRLPWSMM